MTCYVFLLDVKDPHSYDARVGLWSPEKGLISEMWGTGKDVGSKRGLERSGKVLIHFDPQPDGYEVVENPREDPRTKAYFSDSLVSGPKSIKRGFARLPTPEPATSEAPTGLEQLLIGVDDTATPARAAHVFSWNDAVRACMALVKATR